MGRSVFVTSKWWFLNLVKITSGELSISSPPVGLRMFSKNAKLFYLWYKKLMHTRDRIVANFLHDELTFWHGWKFIWRQLWRFSGNSLHFKIMTFDPERLSTYDVQKSLISSKIVILDDIQLLHRHFHFQNVKILFVKWQQSFSDSHRIGNANWFCVSKVYFIHYDSTSVVIKFDWMFNSSRSRDVFYRVLLVCEIWIFVV